MQILLSIIIIILLVIALSGYFYFRKYLQFNSSIQKTIETLKKEALPELMQGKTGFANNGKLKIHYEHIESKIHQGEYIVLLHGLTQTMLALPDHFIQPFLDAGYDVIRIDLRDSGMSSWITNWEQHKYTLEDMAQDVMAVVDHLGIDQFHLMGKSMGGMIAQTVAIHNTNRVKSLTSMMSTAYFYDPELVHVPTKFKFHFALMLLAYHKGLRKLSNHLQFHLAIEHILAGTDKSIVDNQLVVQKAFYDIKLRNGYNKYAQKQQGYAIKKSGSRIEALSELELPVLIVHGKADPLVTFEHGVKCANIILNAETLFIENMGHRLPKIYSDQITEKMIQFLRKHKNEYVQVG